MYFPLFDFFSTVRPSNLNLISQGVLLDAENCILVSGSGYLPGSRERVISQYVCSPQSLLSTDTMGYADTHFKEKSAPSVAHSEPLVYRSVAPLDLVGGSRSSFLFLIRQVWRGLRPVECIVYHASNDMVLQQSQNLILRVKRDFSKIMNPLALFKLEMIISLLSTRIFIIPTNWTKNIK